MVNQFIFLKGADASVRSQILGWNDKITEYLRDLLDNDIERVRGTRFGDNIAKIRYITERAVEEPGIFRGVRDVQNRLQAAAIVESEFDCLFIAALASAPWNILGSMPETLKGAGTSLMKELVNESKNLGFEGRLKLYPWNDSCTKWTRLVWDICGLHGVSVLLSLVHFVPERLSHSAL